MKKNDNIGCTYPKTNDYYMSKITKAKYWQTYTHRLIEQNRNPRNKPMDTWSTNFWQSWKDHSMEKRLGKEFLDDNNNKKHKNKMNNW